MCSITAGIHGADAMNNVRRFPHPPDQDGEVATPADTERLQKLIRDVVEETSSAATAPQDKEIRIRNFRSAKYDLIDDLIIVIEERGGGEYVANSFDTGQYGHGYSPDAAIQHLCSILEDYYELLLEDESRLSERLNAHLRYLRLILR